MASTLSTAALWGLAMVLGIDFGAGLYEARIEVPRWLEWSAARGAYTWHPDRVRDANVGLRFWVFAGTIPLTTVTLLGLVLAQAAKNPARKWWNLSLVLTLVERAFTFSFFIPTMVSLAGPEVKEPTQAHVQKAILWRNLNGVRHVLTLTGWLAALKALSLWEMSDQP